MEANSELKYIFSNVYDLVKFGEAKHGGLVIFNSGLIIGILSNLQILQKYSDKPILITSLICFGLSIFLSIFSQFPVTKNLFKNVKPIADCNLYFFGHLCHFNHSIFVEEFKKACPGFIENKFNKDLINQILVNARIAQSKFYFFKFSSYITAFGTVLIAFFSIVKVIWGF